MARTRRHQPGVFFTCVSSAPRVDMVSVCLFILDLNLFMIVGDIDLRNFDACNIPFAAAAYTFSKVIWTNDTRYT